MPARATPRTSTRCGPTCVRPSNSGAPARAPAEVSGARAAASSAERTSGRAGGGGKRSRRLPPAPGSVDVPRRTDCRRDDEEQRACSPGPGKGARWIRHDGVSALGRCAVRLDSASAPQASCRPGRHTSPRPRRRRGHRHVTRDAEISPRRAESRARECPPGPLTVHRRPGQHASDLSFSGGLPAGRAPLRRRSGAHGRHPFRRRRSQPHPRGGPQIGHSARARIRGRTGMRKRTRTANPL